MISPEGLLISSRVRMVKLPGAQGDFAVLARHIPLISTLRMGEIDLYHDHAVSETFFVPGGVVSVLPDSCSVLVDSMIKVDDLDPEHLQMSLNDLREDLADAKTPEEKRKLDHDLELVNAQLQACQRRKQRPSR